MVREPTKVRGAILSRYLWPIALITAIWLVPFVIALLVTLALEWTEILGRTDGGDRHSWAIVKLGIAVLAAQYALFIVYVTILRFAKQGRG